MKEIILSLVIIILAILFLDPFMLWMSHSVVYMLVGGLLATFIAFAGLVWRERGMDERDELHKMIAGRMAYLAGSTVLVIGIIFQALTGNPDPWLVVALSIMVLVKLSGLLYTGSSR